MKEKIFKDEQEKERIKKKFHNICRKAFISFYLLKSLEEKEAVDERKDIFEG